MQHSPISILYIFLLQAFKSWEAEMLEGPQMEVMAVGMMTHLVVCMLFANKGRLYTLYICNANNADIVPQPFDPDNLLHAQLSFFDHNLIPIFH